MYSHKVMDFCPVIYTLSLLCLINADLIKLRENPPLVPFPSLVVLYLLVLLHLVLPLDVQSDLQTMQCQAQLVRSHHWSQYSWKQRDVDYWIHYIARRSSGWSALPFHTGSRWLDSGLAALPDCRCFLIHAMSVPLFFPYPSGWGHCSSISVCLTMYTIVVGPDMASSAAVAVAAGRRDGLVVGWRWESKGVVHALILGLYTCPICRR